MKRCGMLQAGGGEKGKKLQVKLNTDISSLFLLSQHFLLSGTLVQGNGRISLKFDRMTFNRNSN